MPEFKLLHKNKSFGIEANRVTAKVISVETQEEDAKYMLHLMREADEQGNIRGCFIESGYHRLATPKKLMIAPNNQNIFLHNTRVIPVVGVNDDIMEKELSWMEKKKR